jgi:hypothetical protein
MLFYRKWITYLLKAQGPYDGTDYETRANWGKTVTFAKIPGDSVFEEYKQKNDDEIQHIKMYLYEKCVRESEQ